MNKRFEIAVAEMEKQEELVRALTNLFATREGSQPADREFGISWECLDEIPEVAESLFYLEAVKKVEKYEPRVQIEDITFDYSNGAAEVKIYFGKS